MWKEKRLGPSLPKSKLTAETRKLSPQITWNQEIATQTHILTATPNKVHTVTQDEDEKYYQMD